jgi:sulfonate transport system permease protein
MSAVTTLDSASASRSELRSARVISRLTSAASGWIVPLALLVLWQVASSAGLLASEILPAPSDVVAGGIRLARSGELSQDMKVSFLRAGAGFLVGGSIGFALAIANGLSTTSEMLLDSTLQMLRNVPHLALIPLVILWFGIDEGAKLFLVALGVFFPVYLNTLHGIRSVDPQLIEMGQSYGMRRAELFRRVVLPGALPSIFVGLRYALGIMWLTLIVAETIAANSGIGYLTMQAREFMQTDVVVLGIVIYALLGKLADIVGRSGCGKSTLLRILAGLDRPTGGRFWFGDSGIELAREGGARVMFQEHRLLPWARVLANVEVGLGAERGKADATERAREALRAVELEARARDWPAVLSGGQKQRVALARALVSRPKLLALDEPLGALDALTRIGMQRLIERVWGEQGFTAILVTHDVTEALLLADRIVLVEEGRVTLDLPVDVPRPRRHGSVELAAIEQRILRRLLREDIAHADYVI